MDGDINAGELESHMYKYIREIERHYRAIAN